MGIGRERESERIGERGRERCKGLRFRFFEKKKKIRSRGKKSQFVPRRRRSLSPSSSSTSPTQKTQNFNSQRCVFRVALLAGGRARRAPSRGGVGLEDGGWEVVTRRGGASRGLCQRRKKNLFATTKTQPRPRRKIKKNSATMTDKPSEKALSQHEQPPTGAEAPSLTAPRATGEGKAAGEAAGGISMTAAGGKAEVAKETETEKKEEGEKVPSGGPPVAEALKEAEKKDKEEKEEAKGTQAEKEAAAAAAAAPASAEKKTGAEAAATTAAAEEKDAVAAPGTEEKKATEAEKEETTIASKSAEKAKEEVKEAEKKTKEVEEEAGKKK